MPKVLIIDEHLSNIASAIRNKTGETTTYYPSEMAAAINNIQTVPNLQDKSYTPTVTGATITADTGYDGLSSVTVSPLADGNSMTYGTNTAVTQVLISKSKLDTIAQQVYNKNSSVVLPIDADDIAAGIADISTSADVRLQQKSVDPSTSQQVVLPDAGYQGMTQVRVGAIQTDELSVVADGEYVPTTGRYYSKVTVATGGGGSINLQAKTATPLESQQIITPDSALGYNGLSQVTVEAIPSQYKNVSTVTATASDVLSGKVIVDANGVQQTGILSVNSYYVGLDTPADTLGDDGDLYFKV